MGTNSNDDIIPLERTSTSERPAATRSGAGQTGSAVRTGSDPRCSSCGYSMKGLRSLRCPECGKTMSATALGKTKDAGVDAQRNEVRVLTIMLVVGLLGALGLMLLMHGWQGAVGYLVIFAISVPAGLAAYFICCLLWVGFDEPLPVVAFKLAAIYAVVDCLSYGLLFVPALNTWLLRTGIVAVVYIGLLMKQLELDTWDAIGVAIATFIMKVIVGVAILSVLVNVFGLTI